MKRRRSQLGASESSHYHAARKDFESSAAESDATIRHVESGWCAGAFSSYQHAASRFSSGYTHAQSSNIDHGGEKAVIAGKKLTDAEKALKRCLRKAPK